MRNPPVQPRPPLVPVTDEFALQVRFQQGDREAFRALVAPHVDALYTLCLRMTNDHAEADDLTQAALERALVKHRRYLPGKAMRPWLLTIGANLCRSRLRSPWWRRRLPFEDEDHVGSSDPELSAVALDSDRKVRAALAKLPVLYREAVALFHLDDLSYAEIEEITGVAIPTLKQRVRRGLGMLHRMVASMYPELELERTGTEDDEP